MTDTLGNGLTFAAVTAPGIFICNSTGPSNVTCTLPISTAPGSYQVSYTATVTAAATGSVDNAVLPTGPDNPACGTCTTTTPVTPSAVTVNKATPTPGPVVVGSTITYTLTVDVANSQTTGVTELTDTLGNGLAFAAVTAPSIFICNSTGPSNVTCTLPISTAPGSYQVSYTATVTAAATGSVDNAVLPTGPDNPACGTCTTTTPVTPSAVTVNKATPTLGPVVVGSTITYTLTVDVANSQTTAVTELTDTLGNGLAFAAVTAPGIFICNSTGPSNVTCTLPIGTAPGSYQVSYTATVTATATGSVDNAVLPTGPDNPACGTCTTTTPVTPSAVAYGKTSSTAGPVVAGDVITYTLTTTVTNSQTTGLTTLTDTMSSGLTFVAVTVQIPAAAYTCNATNPLICTLPAGTLPGVYTVTYTAQVNASATGTVTNAVLGTGNDNPTCSGVCDTTTTVTPSALTYGKTASTAGPVAVGDVITYTLTTTVTNSQTTGLTTLTDTMSSGLTFVAVTGQTPAAAYACNATNPLICTLPAGTVPGAYTVTYTAQVNASATGTVTNAVLGTGNDNPTCSGVCDTTTTVTPSALTYGKTASTAGPVAVGDVITYTLTTTVTNSQTTGLTTLTDTMSSGLTFVAVTGQTPAAAYTCNATNPLICTLPAGTVPGAYTVTYTAQVNASATGTVTNAVLGTGNDNPTCSGVCNTTTTVTPSAVTYGKTSSTAGPVAVGDVITYTLTTTVTNSQTTGLTTLTDTMSSGLTFVAVTGQTPATAYTCNATNPLICTLPPGTVPGVYTVTYTAQVDVSATGTVTNAVLGTGNDNPTCSGVCDTTTTLTPSAVTVLKTATPTTPVSVGDTVTYTVTVTVANSQTLGVVTLTDTLGTGLTFGAVTSAGAVTCSGALTCTLPANTAPGSYPVTYTATINNQATGNVTNMVVPSGPDDPSCTTCTTTTPVVPPAVSYTKSASTAGPVVVGDVITYTLTATVTNAQTTGVTTLTDTMGSGLDFVAVTSAGAFTCNAANPLVCTLPAGTVPGSYAMSYTARVNGQAGGSVNNAVVGTGTDAPNCSNVGCSVTTEVAPPVVSYTKSASTAGPVAQGDTITYTLTTTVANAPTRNALTLTDTLGTGLDFTAVTGAAGYSCNAANPLVCTLPAGTVPGTYTVSYTATVNAQASETVNNTVVGTGTDNPACVGVCTTSTTVAPPPTLRVIKQASPRDVKIGDLVRYTVTVENTGTVDAIDATLVDTPPAGFTFVDGSLSVADRDGVGRLVGTYPIQVDQVDIAAGERATFTYLLRVGAGVRAGIHSNSALMRDNGKIVSNVATAEVQFIADPLLDHALILGTVFDDRDGDGWQDSAAIDDARVQGGFAAEAYVPNSTTVDRGNGPKAEPDASSPMLHGIVLGSISARQSDADPADAHRGVISQRLKELSFNDDFALTTQQGVTVRMDAAGTTRIERSGDAAKNLSGAAPTVERRVSPTEGGYLVDYIVRNTGVDERGIPGVRIASIEGLLMETDQYGRYHLEGVDVGTLERGRNFILKVDPSTLPPGTVFTTDNPLTRRVTPGLPVRFDWGVKLPAGLIEGGEEQVEMELGEVFFAPGSAEVRAQYLPAIEKMAEKIKQHRGGEVVISANGDSESLAFDRASAVKAALVKQLPADVLQALKVSVRGNADDPGSLIVGLGEGGALLGTVLFDTNKETIRPEFEPLLDKVAAALERMHGGVIAIVGPTDVRASYQYNTALDMRRAKAVYDALAQRLSPEVRAKVRVESRDDPTALVDA
ncbi:isopeptide-forming domain-containing fimbrial protein [Lysobacter antibioticus]|uniref:isopeptide-forming domain-containing fimbrial protein n=1 Tax=Lysobacter antibioticus TaxID=84531 RepID=UPI001651711B|nr:isopeptide-forming domain-containing fimbrial protein [Lysobacter antibioticus]